MTDSDSGYPRSIWHKRLRKMGGVVTVSVVFGVLYPVINREFNNPIAFINGASIGFLGGLAIALSEDYGHYIKIKREHFLLKLIRNTALYTVYFALIIALAFGVFYGLINGQGLWNYYTGAEFKNFIFEGDYLVILLYALFFCGLVSFGISMSHKVESKVIINIISGKYHQPKMEQRIFITIDLNNSTGIAEQLGEARFFDFLNHFYLDLTPAILGTNADIYRYVGDQVTLSWPVKSEPENNQCLLAYNMAHKRITSNQSYYLEKWGVAAKFKAVVHAGTVVAGEIGDAKRQFVYHGKMFQTMFMVEKLCKPMGVQILITSTAADLMDLSSNELVTVTELATEESTTDLTLFTLR